MKFVMLFFITFFFSFLIPHLDMPDAVNGSIETDPKTSMDIARSASTHNVVHKVQMQAGNTDQIQIDFPLSIRKSRRLNLQKYRHVEVSGFVSSGAKINQHIASA